MKSSSLAWVIRFLFIAVLAAALGLGFSPESADAETKDGKYLIYYSMSYVGNAWQTEAKNTAVAMSKTAPYRDRVELRIQASGANAARQLQQMNAMVQAGADANFAFPISPTALIGVIRNACDEGVVVAVVKVAAHKARCALPARSSYRPRASHAASGWRRSGISPRAAFVPSLPGPRRRARG